MTALREALRDAVADPPYDDLDLRTVLVEARRRKARRQRWLVGGVLAATATTVLAVFVGTALVGDREEPEPAPPPEPSPVEHVDALYPADALPFPSQPSHTHHAPAPSNRARWGLDTDRIVGVTDDGLLVRVRNVYRGDSTTFALVDPRTGATEWLPDHGYDLGAPTALSLESERLYFIDNRDLTDDVLVYDRVSGSWAKHDPIRAMEGTQQMYPVEPTRTLTPDGRLWFVAYPGPASAHPTCPLRADVDPSCWYQWWSVPFPAGGQARREPHADRTWLAWSGETLATGSRDRIVLGSDGEDRTVPLAVPEGCDVPTSSVPTVYAADPLVATIGCADGSSTVAVYGDAGDPLFSVTGSLLVTAVGEGFVGLTRYSENGPETAYLLDVADRRLYRLPGGGRSVVTDIAGGMVLWQDPEDGWIDSGGHEYWAAPLP